MMQAHHRKSAGTKEGRENSMPKDPVSALDAHMGARVKRLRLQAGISQTELGKRLGWDQTTVSTYELGQRQFAIVDLVRVAEAVGTPLMDLLGPPLEQSGHWVMPRPNGAPVTQTIACPDLPDAHEAVMIIYPTRAVEVVCAQCAKRWAV
jgi:transcriptional regulator with XRE-family HTH domain